VERVLTKESAEEAIRQAREIIIRGVRLVMVEANWPTQKAAARASRVGETTLSACLVGENSFSVDTLAKLSAASGIPISQMWSRGESSISAERDRRELERLRAARKIPEVVAALRRLSPEVLSAAEIGVDQVQSLVELLTDLLKMTQRHDGGEAR